VERRAVDNQPASVCSWSCAALSDFSCSPSAPYADRAAFFDFSYLAVHFFERLSERLDERLDRLLALLKFARALLLKLGKSLAAWSKKSCG